MSAHDPFETVAGISLEAHVEELRRRREATARLQGSATHYLEEVRLFRNYAVERGLCHLPSALPELTREPDDEGNEHQVWYRRDFYTYLKVTWPDFFGLLVIHRPDEDERASPIAYLERWHLHNKLFGDNVRFLGVVEAGGNMRMVIEQPAIKACPPLWSRSTIFSPETVGDASRWTEKSPTSILKGR
jgi:hypothetical protein